MDFSLTPEQALLRDSLRAFLRDRYTLASRTAASGSETGWRADIWASLGRDLGILGAAFPETIGGSGGGPVDTMVIMEELGRALVLEPFLESVVMAGGLLRRVPGLVATEALGRVLRGESSIAVGWTEPGARFALDHVETTARRERFGWRLDGHKSAVIAAPWASQLIVTARTGAARDDAKGISLFLLDRDSPGVTLCEFHTIDGRRAADVMLSGVTLSPQALLGEEGEAIEIVEQVADEAVAALCAEAVGLMEKMLHDTVEYTQQRRQFGQPISSFQVLQHRMADMLMHTELARSALYDATLKLGAPRVSRAKAASAAKVTIDQASRYVGQNAVQLHGGMGMSDDVAVTHYFRRATAIANTLGSEDHHLARFSQLEGRERIHV